MATKPIQCSLLSRLKYPLIMFLFTCLSANAKQPVVASYYFATGDPIAVSSLPAEKLSHILYAFIALCGDNSGANDATRKAIANACEGKKPYSAVLFSEKDAMAELNAFKTLKQQHPHLRILPSFGGWTLSQPFHGMAKSEAARKHFVHSAIELITKHNVFDGIDIDWEYPGGGGNRELILTGAAAHNEKEVFSLLMQELRAELNKLGEKAGRNYQLTAAVSGSTVKTGAVDWLPSVRAMDYVFVMTYDFAVGNGRAGHHTNLFSSDEKGLSAQVMISNLLNAGVPAHKLVLGVAFYGRGWTNSGWQGDNFDESNQAVSIGTYVYKDLKTNPPQGYRYGYDSKAQAAYFFNDETQGFISFDDRRSVLAKAKWAKSSGLAGLFSWQILQDNGELLDAMSQGMHANSKETDAVDNKP